jgi:hypothetical protein
LTYSRRDIDRHDPVTQLLLLLVRNCVGADHLLKLAVVDLVDCVAAEDTVCHDRNGSSCTVLDDHVGRFAKGSASVCHVVDDDGGAALDVSDEDHAADFVGTSTLFVDERELNVEAVGDGGCSVNAVSANYAQKHICELSCPTSSLLQHRVKRSRIPAGSSSPGST